MLQYDEKITSKSTSIFLIESTSNLVFCMPSIALFDCIQTLSHSRCKFFNEICIDIIPCSIKAIKKFSGGSWLWVSFVDLLTKNSPNILNGVHVRAHSRPRENRNTLFVQIVLYCIRFMHRGIILLENNIPVVFLLLVSNKWNHDTLQNVFNVRLSI